jgi:delta 1-pyrroline-5-carboxylate dehydrogenase
MPSGRGGTWTAPSPRPSPPSPPGRRCPPPSAPCGPIIPVLPFSDEDEAVRLANDTEYGLAASVWSDDTERAWQLARRLAAGSVFVNVHRVGASPMSLPFGGFKQSGTGRNHGIESVLACMEPQAVVEFDDPGALPGTDHWNALLKTADDKAAPPLARPNGRKPAPEVQGQ